MRLGHGISCRAANATESVADVVGRSCRHSQRDVEEFVGLVWIALRQVEHVGRPEMRVCGRECLSIYLSRRSSHVLAFGAFGGVSYGSLGIPLWVPCFEQRAASGSHPSPLVCDVRAEAQRSLHPDPEPMP